MGMIEQFVEFMIERENIRIRKENGEPWPWTGDTILQEFKFTNVHRRDDRTSREFLRIYEDLFADFHPTHAQMLYASGVLRYFGTIEFARELKSPQLLQYDPRELVLKASTMRRSGQKVFTSAYVITNGGRSEPKENVVVDYLEGLWNHSGDITTRMMIEHRWELGYQELRKLPGFGGSGFMAKEVLQDWLMIYPDVVIEDRTRWTPMGPGARRGINRIYERGLGYTQQEQLFIVECQLTRQKVEVMWPSDWESLSAHDIQFQLCEFDKYMRAKSGQGRPKSRYHRASR